MLLQRQKFKLTYLCARMPHIRIRPPISHPIDMVNKLYPRIAIGIVYDDNNVALHFLLSGWYGNNSRSGWCVAEWYLLVEPKCNAANINSKIRKWFVYGLAKSGTTSIVKRRCHQAMPLYLIDFYRRLPCRNRNKTLKNIKTIEETVHDDDFSQACVCTRAFRYPIWLIAVAIGFIAGSTAASASKHFELECVAGTIVLQ